MARLIVLQGEASHPQVSFENACLIGRGGPCDLLLFDATASRTHARVEKRADGPFTLTDLESANGTLLNGEPVDNAVLFDGDEIEIGQARLRFMGSAGASMLHDTGWLIRERLGSQGLLLNAFAREDGVAKRPLGILHEIAGLRDEAQLAENLVKMTLASFEGDQAGFLPEDETGRRFEEVLATDAPSAWPGAVHEELSRSQSCLLLQDPRAEERDTEESYRSMMVMALQSEEGTCAGYLYVASQSQRPYTLTDLEALSLLAVPLVRMLRMCRDARQLSDELEKLRHKRAPRDVKSESAPYRQMLTALEGMTALDSPVLLIGERGTGKEWLARWLHQESKRERAPFLQIQCKPLSDDVLERELVGREQVTGRGSLPITKGLLARAAHGTLFLDSFTARSEPLQRHLLQMLGEHAFLPEGTDEKRTHQARLIFSIEAPDLESALTGFTPSLAAALKPHAIRVPPLRERTQDLPNLVRTLLARLRQESPISARGLSDDAMTLLERHGFPGNIRELKAMLEVAAMRSEKPWIEAGDLLS